MRPVAVLGNEQGATLSMLLHLGKTYADVAVLLGIEEQEVRQHAHRALVEIAPRESAYVAPELRESLGDYLLGQCSNPPDCAKCSTGGVGCYRVRAWAQTVNEGLTEFLDLAPFELRPLPGRGPHTAGPLAVGSGERVATRGATEGGAATSSRRRSRRVTTFVATALAVIVGICAALLIGPPRGIPDHRSVRTSRVAPSVHRSRRGHVRGNGSARKGTPRASA